MASPGSARPAAAALKMAAADGAERPPKEGAGCGARWACARGCRLPRAWPPSICCRASRMAGTASSSVRLLLDPVAPAGEPRSQLRGSAAHGARGPCAGLYELQASPGRRLWVNSEKLALKGWPTSGCRWTSRPGCQRAGTCQGLQEATGFGH